MENQNNSQQKILTISEQKQKKMEEVQRRLQDHETQKARKLLATAMSNYETLFLVKDNIERKVYNGQYHEFASRKPTK